MEKNTEESSFSGKIIHQNSLKAAVNERKIESYIVLFSGVLASISLYLTSPISLVDFSSNVWGYWYQGTLSRIGTATLLTVIITGLEFFLYWQSIRREPFIQWNV